MMGQFSNVNFEIVGEEVSYSCSRCGEELAVASLEYYQQNRLVASEDYPLQLWNQNYPSCTALREQAEEMAVTAREHGANATAQEVLEMLA